MTEVMAANASVHVFNMMGQRVYIGKVPKVVIARRNV